MNNVITEITIHGYLVGPIWQPVSEECSKPFTHDTTAYDRRCGERNTLREHVFEITRDRDFQHCEIADGYLEVSRTMHGGWGNMITHTRKFNLERFPSITDYLKTNWEGLEE